MRKLIEKYPPDSKTWRFLLPCLKEYGPDFTLRINSLFKVSAYIKDVCQIKEESPVIYLACSYKADVTKFHKVCDWLEGHESFVRKYPLSARNYDSLYMLVFRVPNKYEKAYHKFLEGKYSEMYSKAEIDKLFKSNFHYKERLVFNRDPKALNHLVQEIKKEFNSSIKIEDLDLDVEMSLPLKNSEEIFGSEDESFIRSEKDLFTNLEVD